MTTKDKEFDCVEMMHEGALHIYETLKGKTQEEQLAYWQARHLEALKAQELARAANTAEV